MGITIANRDLGLRTDGRKPKRIGGYLLAEEGKEIMNQVNDLTEAVIDLQDGTVDLTDLNLTGELTVDTISGNTGTGVNISGVYLNSGYTFTDLLDEYTPSAGVTTTSTFIIDKNGLVATPSLVVGRSGNGFYEVSPTQLGASVSDTLVAMFNANGIATNAIEEQVTDTGVSVDGLTIKDGSTGKRVAATATADGLTTGLLTGSDQFVTVTAEDPNHIITLPLSTGIIVGTTIEGYVGANGFELRVDASEATTATINGVTTNVEAAIPAATYFVAKLVAARKWLVFGYDQTGSNFAIIPDAV